MKPALKAPETKLLKLKYDELLSHFAFKFNFRRLNRATPAAARPCSSSATPVSITGGGAERRILNIATSSKT
jgi:hypothetical protein